MDHLRIKSIKDIEKALWLFYRYIPQLPDKIGESLCTIFPYFAVLGGAMLISMGILPFIFPEFPIDPLRGSDLFTFNIIMSRILFVLMGVILIISFEKLSKKKLAGWYNIFYLTLFHLFFVLIVFNIYSLLILLIDWYILFVIKPYFNE